MTGSTPTRVPSERLVDDLDIGQLRGVTLSRRQHEYAGPGVDQLVRREDHRVVLSLAPAAGKGPIEQFLSNLLPKARADGFESVTFHIEKLPGNQTNNPTLRLDDHDAMEQLYVRAKRLVFLDILLEQCYAQTCDHIASKMIAVLHDDDNW